MAGFARLIPAFTAHVCINEPTVVGEVSSGTSLMHVGFVADAGFIRSEPGYPIRLDAVFAHGSDYIRRDPDGEHVRLDVVSIARDRATGAVVKFDYTGTISTTGPAGKVLTGAPDAATTDFGEAFTHVTFETAAPELKAIQRKVYVASGRFILEQGKPVTVEYKISEVVL